MGRIIRLTERDLTRIVKQVINEEQVSQAKSKQMASQAKLRATDCWDAEKYPLTAKALKTAQFGGATVALIAAAAALAATGVGIPAALLLFAGIVTVSHAMYEVIKPIIYGHETLAEMKELGSCLFDTNEDFYSSMY
jgi:hypothetical protein